MNDGHKAKHEIEKDGERGVGLLDEAKDRISDLTDDAKTQGVKLIGQVKDRGNELWNDAQNQGKNVFKNVQTRIEKNPWKAVGYALAAGAALFALFGRKEDKR